MVVRTNNPPCGAMRGFGAVQVCFAHESQMDRLAARARASTPSSCGCATRWPRATCCPPASVITGTAPVAECIRAAVAHPLPPPAGDGLLERPGGAGRTDDPARTRRGVGVAVGFKNLLYSEGFDDTSEARVRLAGGVATVTCAVAEVGQGFVTIAGQIARTALGCDAVVVEPAGTADDRARPGRRRRRARRGCRAAPCCGPAGWWPTRCGPTWPGGWAWPPRALVVDATDGRIAASGAAARATPGSGAPST